MLNRFRLAGFATGTLRVTNKLYIPLFLRRQLLRGISWSSAFKLRVIYAFFHVKLHPVTLAVGRPDVQFMVQVSFHIGLLFTYHSSTPALSPAPAP
mgnify:CR=1 FL=1